jgi:L-lactate dehydrogenase
VKIGVVGTGLVGSTAAYALVARGVGREVVLVDKSADRARAEADDISHAIPFEHPLTVRAGEYADLSGSRAVILAAGVGQRPGESRLELLTRNAAVFAEVVPSVIRHAPEAVIVVATNPVDVMTHLAVHYAAKSGGAAGRVLGSGTTLDTARFRSLLGRHCGVDPHHVHAYVVGEHGDSEVLTWSQAMVGGMAIADYCAAQQRPLTDEVRGQIDQQVRRAAYSIIHGKGATYYGIGSALATIVDVILHDQRAIMTVCSPMSEVQGVRDVTLSLPQRLGGEGVIDSLPLRLDESEQEKLRASAQTIRSAIDELAI